MTTSFYNSISGLMSFQQGIDIWGDNIANINTIGFKEKTPEFDTIFSSTLSNAMGSSDIGMGSTLSTSALDLSQGSIVQTQNKFDLAIGGSGWFAVKHGDSTFYTRNGAFVKDAQGYLVNDSGDYLLVANANNLIKQDDGSYVVDTTKTLPEITPNNLSPISLPNNVTLPAVATKNVTLQSNLNDSDQILYPTPATNDLSFSALYDQYGNNLKMQDNQSIVFGFGNPVTNNSNKLSSTFCINDDEVDGEDVNIDFTINSKEIKLTLPDGSDANTIANAISEELAKNGIESQVENGNLTITTQNEFLLSSNDKILPPTSAAILTFKNDPVNEFDFSTPEDFKEKLQLLADIAYPKKTEVDFSDGEFLIKNNSEDVLNAYALPTENTNEEFLTNLGRLGNVIAPNTGAKSMKFTSNTKTFGGNIYQSNGEKDTITFEFTKAKVQNNQIIWRGNISISNELGEISKISEDFIFDTNGVLISPKELKINNPQEMTLNFNLTSFAKIDDQVNYNFLQDGIEAGYLKDYQINDDGKILAQFSNSKAVVLGQIPLFHFQNEQGLDSIGGNLFTPTSNSNQAILYQDENGYIPGATIISGSLENSNVNMTTAMTELIVTQKAFSASAKTVTTSDEMIQKAINLKR